MAGLSGRDPEIGMGKSGPRASSETSEKLKQRSRTDAAQSVFGTRFLRLRFCEVSEMSRTNHMLIGRCVMMCPDFYGAELVSGLGGGAW